MAEAWRRRRLQVKPTELTTGVLKIGRCREFVMLAQSARAIA